MQRKSRAIIDLEKALRAATDDTGDYHMLAALPDKVKAVGPDLKGLDGNVLRAYFEALTAAS
jgi:hypothetical protein